MEQGHVCGDEVAGRWEMLLPKVVQQAKRELVDIERKDEWLHWLTRQG